MVGVVVAVEKSSSFPDRRNHMYKDESLSQEGRKCWGIVVQLGQGAGVGSEDTWGCQGRKKSDQDGSHGPFAISEKGRILEIDAAWIIQIKLDPFFTTYPKIASRECIFSTQ